MSFNISAELITIFIGVITLIIGVFNSVKTNKQTVKSQHLQIIFAVSESFRQKWELDWSDILDELDVDHINPRTEELPGEQVKNIRYMLNWVDWLGALKSSGALNELNILTSSIGIPIKRIINVGYTVLREDTKNYGEDYWKNLFVVADYLNVKCVTELRSVNS